MYISPSLYFLACNFRTVTYSGLQFPAILAARCITNGKGASPGSRSSSAKFHEIITEKLEKYILKKKQNLIPGDGRIPLLRRSRGAQFDLTLGYIIGSAIEIPNPRSKHRRDGPTQGMGALDGIWENGCLRFLVDWATIAETEGGFRIS